MGVFIVGTAHASSESVKAIALLLWMLLFGRDDLANDKAAKVRAQQDHGAEARQEREDGRQDEDEDEGEEERAKANERTKKSRRALPVPWPMVCHFIVRVIDGPGDTAVVVAKRDCPDD